MAKSYRTYAEWVRFVYLTRGGLEFLPKMHIDERGRITERSLYAQRGSDSPPSIANATYLGELWPDGTFYPADAYGALYWASRESEGASPRVARPASGDGGDCLQ